MSTLAPRIVPSALKQEPINYRDLANKMSTLGKNLKAWSDEQQNLASLRASDGILTEVQNERLRNLNSAMDVYDAYLSDLGPLPDQSYIEAEAVEGWQGLDTLERDIWNARKLILETQQNEVFSDDYKDWVVKHQNAAIATWTRELAAKKKLIQS